MALMATTSSVPVQRSLLRVTCRCGRSYEDYIDYGQRLAIHCPCGDRTVIEYARPAPADDPRDEDVIEP